MFSFLVRLLKRGRTKTKEFTMQEFKRSLTTKETAQRIIEIYPHDEAVKYINIFENLFGKPIMDFEESKYCEPD